MKMKGFFAAIVFASAFIMSSCVNDNTSEVSAGKDEGLVFRVVLDDCTRVGFTGEKYFWEGDEELGIYVNSSTPATNVLASVELRSDGGYCTVPLDSFSEDDQMYVYYPHSRDNDMLSYDKVELEIPDVQVQPWAGVFNAANLPMVSDPVNLVSGEQTQAVHLHALGGFLCFNVYASGAYAGEKVQSIVYRTGTTPSAGSFRFDLSSVSASMPAISGYSSTEVSVDLEEPYTVGATLDAAESIYMVLAPGTYSGDLLIVTDKAVYNYDYDRTVERNTYYHVNVNLSEATSRTEHSTGETIVASLTYAEASSYANGYSKPNTYSNDYGTWTICAYDYGSAFQLNKDKVAYIGTPKFDGDITEIVINTVENFTGDIYICTSAGSSSATDIVATQRGGGSTTTVDLSTQSLTQVYIRSSAVCRISDITVTCNDDSNPFEPVFSDLKSQVTGTSYPTASDGSVTLSATIKYNADLASIAASGFAFKSTSSSDYIDKPCGTSATPSVTIAGLAGGSYDYYVYATMSDGQRYESGVESFFIRSSASGSSYKYGWFELPVQTDEDNNGIDDENPDYYYSHTFRADAQSIRNFSCCYSKGKIHPIWVAAPMHSSYLGNSGRNNSYRDDPNIKCPQASKFEGYTRGHMVGSSDRTVSVATNKQAFYHSNIGAQMSSGFNTGGGAWNNLESVVDGLLCPDTLYQVIGVVFQTWTDNYGHTTSAKTGTSSDGTFQVPTGWYKVLLRTKKGNTGKRVDECSRSELQCVAFMLGHYSNKGHQPSEKDMFTVSEIEEMTGLTFFPNVPNAPKDEFNASDWL